jgi:hypothetical protein
MCVGRLDRELQSWAIRTGRELRRWHFVDDFVFQAHPIDVLPVLHEWERLCARAGVTLVKSKCTATWPAYAAVVSSAEVTGNDGNAFAAQYMLEEMREISAVVKFSPHHIKLLGAALGGDVCVDFKYSDDGLPVVSCDTDSPMFQRLQRALRLASGLCAMAQANLQAGGKQPAWHILRDCLCNALSFDARVCEAVQYSLFAGKLRQEIIKVAQCIVGVELNFYQAEQLFLRREEGGMQFNDPVASGVRARVAAVTERGPILRTAMARLFHGYPREVLQKAECVGDAASLLGPCATRG